MDFAVPVNHRVKLKESEKKDYYLDFARELKKKTVEHESDGYTNSNWCSWYSYYIIWLVKELEYLEIRGRVETTQTTALLRSTRIIIRVLESWGDLLSLKLQWETIGWRRCERLEKELKINTPQNSTKLILRDRIANVDCGDSDGTVNPIISECNLH